MNTIFRIQNKNGNGPYVNQNLSCLANDTSCSGHPAPYADEGIDRLAMYKERCGFHSIQQLKEWFNVQTLFELKKHGFDIVEVQGKITARGKKQILFIYP